MSACVPDSVVTIAMAARGRIVTSSNGVALGTFSLPTDPIGTCTRTFDGVPAGSEIRIYRADGVELAGVESCASADPQLSWSVYAPGANSVNRIVIINLAYKIKEFIYTPSVGTGSIPVQMDDDDWYSNPV